MKKITFFIALVLAACTITANPGDTIHVITHNNVTVVTNPSLGANSYLAWGQFPQNISVRKIFVTMKYRCPSGMACGEWDYIDNVKIRRKGGVDSTDKNIEIVRYITPYGNSFTSTYAFNWHMDITDYAAFLRDSVEIEYIHTGYETNVGKGWAVTLDFNIIEGTPDADFASFTQIIDGSYQIGNPADPIENHLPATPFTTTPDQAFTKLRIVHTGHGSDDNYCSEFCDKWRKVYIDGNMENMRHRWRTCGGNALYPQGGTWLYDRGNWCPGSVIFPDFVQKFLPPSTTHTVDIDMEPYTGSGSYGNEVINAQLFQFKAINHAKDVAIEELIRPSKISEYTRLNPICRDPQLQIKNHGSDPVTSVEFKYGIEGNGLQTYTWNGSALAFGDTTTLTLPGLSWGVVSNARFIAYINQVNGAADEYHYDDTARCSIVLPTQYDTAFVIFYNTNAVPSENSYEVTDENGNVILARYGNTLAANTLYKDTLRASPGCYKFRITDSGGDGLSFWANTAQGNGTLRFRKMGSPVVYLKTINPDFGNFYEENMLLRYPTTVGIKEEATTSEELIVYPNPSAGKFYVEFNPAGSTKDESISVTDILGKTIYTAKINSSVQNDLSIDLSSFDNGTYFIRYTAQGKAVVKKIVINK